MFSIIMRYKYPNNNLRTFVDFWIWITIYAMFAPTREFSPSSQRWKYVQILQIYLCYFSRAVLIFWLYTRKLAKDIVILALCSKQYT